jgi:hypothetical protein
MIKTIGIILALICLSNLPAFAVTGNDLVEDARFYDGARIEFVGEVIGDIMAREDFVWLNVNDGTRAIGVWASKQQIKDIKISGDYNHVGDRIRINGVFNRACPQHGGDLDIHAQQITIVEKGHRIEHPLDLKKVAVTAVLFLMVLGVVFLPRYLKVKSGD